MAARKKAARVQSSGSKNSSKKRGAKKRVTKKTAKQAVKKAAKSPAAAASKRTPRKAVSRRRRVVSTETAPSFPEIAALAELMQAHGLLEVDYETAPDGSTRIHVMRSDGVFAAAPAPMVAPVAPAAPVAAAAAQPSAPPEPADAGLVPFKSPMVGTFYRAPSPEATSFANVGDVVDTASVVCIIEAMKVMNEITPDLGGEIVSIEVENGGAVEFGQTLMLIRPR